MSETPLPLGYAEQMNPPPRPSLRDPRVRRNAAEGLLPDIIDWYGQNWRENEREEVIEDLMAIVGESDGYHAARALEQRSHWECDAGLVEILGDGDWTYRAVTDAVCEWVEYNKIAPKFAVGDIVKTPHGTGPIVSVHPKEATYTVQTDDFLEKNPTQAGKGGGYVVAFEKCEREP
jgi:hypothetical protein